MGVLRPDLIVTVSGLEEETYNKLSQIAPTLAQAPGEGSYSSAPWQVNQQMVGEALGLEDEAQRLIGEVEGLIAAARGQHPEFKGRTAVVAGIYEGQYSVRGSKEVWSEFLAELGFKITEELASDDYQDVSTEFIEKFSEPDALVWLGTPEEVWTARCIAA